MTRTKLEDVISYAETQLNTLTKLDSVKYTDTDSQPIRVKTYGAHIYIDPADFFAQEFEHIGPFATERWSVNVDIIINRNLADRKSISDSFGISYWVDTIRNLFMNGTNDGKFKNSWWDYTEQDPSEDLYTIKGVFQCEILNNYT